MKWCFVFPHTHSWINSSRRLACLKYLVLANMLMKSGINPFDSQEVIELIRRHVDVADDVILVLLLHVCMMHVDLTK